MVINGGNLVWIQLLISQLDVWPNKCWQYFWCLDWIIDRKVVIVSRLLFYKWWCLSLIIAFTILPSHTCVHCQFMIKTNYRCLLMHLKLLIWMDTLESDICKRDRSVGHNNQDMEMETKQNTQKLVMNCLDVLIQMQFDGKFEDWKLM